MEKTILKNGNIILWEGHIASIDGIVVEVLESSSKMTRDDKKEFRHKVIGENDVVRFDFSQLKHK